jgi:glyoxylase-like metal-dependent hydrolase (beta-lactamase superfamily II)
VSWHYNRDKSWQRKETALTKAKSEENMTPFEDTWCDVMQKAMRGLSISAQTLAHSANVPQSLIEELLKGILKKEILPLVARALALSPIGLLGLAEEIPRKPCALPEQISQFTTLYHGMQVHSYLLWSKKNKEAAAFDTGTDLTDLFKKCKKEALTLRSLFLTHGHGDHVAALQELRAYTGAEVWIGAADLVAGVQALPPDFSYQLDETLHIKARPTPGHSPGGMTYVITGLSKPVAIVGDAIFARSVGGISATSYLEGLQAIRENILSLPDDTILCPGHGPLTTVEDERKHSPFFASA